MAQRIEYIDSAKGLCMLLIVASHVGIPDPWPGAYAVRVILFFVLSGYFFSVKLQPKEFFRKKLKTLLVPFLFWWVLSYALFYLGLFLIPNFTDLTPAKGIFDCFTQKEYFNGPLWFLPALFFLQAICYLVEYSTKHTIYRLMAYAAIGVMGFELALYEIDLPLNIDTALSSTPFFVMGMLLRRYSVLAYFEKSAVALTSAAVLYGLYLLCPVAIFMSVNRFGNSFPEVYGIGAALCMAYILLTKLASKYLIWTTKALAYVGYNSLIVMCAHHLLYRPFKVILMQYSFGEIDGLILLAVSTGLSLLMAPLAEKYFPFVIGKERTK